MTSFSARRLVVIGFIACGVGDAARIKSKKKDTPAASALISKYSALAASDVQADASVCDTVCDASGGSHSCRARILWLKSGTTNSFADIVSQVNGECAGQCSCTEQEFGDVVPGAVAGAAATTTATTTIAPPQVNNSIGNVRIMTFNTQNPNGNNFHTIGHCVQHGKADIMLFQECQSPVHKELHGLGGYDVAGGEGDFSGLGLAWRTSMFTKVGGPWKAWVGQDLDNCCCNVHIWKGGKCWDRFVVSVRLRHQNGQHVILADHHGILPINSGGKTGHAAAAANLNNAIEQHREAGDAVILGGDFNNIAGQSETIRLLEESYGFRRHADHWVDNIFSKGWTSQTDMRNYGSCMSDHDSIAVTLV